MTSKKNTLSWLKDLNKAQREAVTHGDGPLLVVAGAGTGKTRTLAYRVAYLLSQGADPRKILLLTFTRRAAQEMLSRASAVITKGTSITGHVWGGTFHATGNRILRIYSKAAGLDKDFTVMDRGDAEDMLNIIRHDMGLQSKEIRFPRKRTCLGIYSRVVNSEDSLSHVLERYYPWCDEWETKLKAMFKKYVSRKQERNVLDYDDLLLYWAKLVEDREMASKIGSRFEHILVDEYQDTNKIQADILRGMRRDNDNIMVVGDDAQSIYSFRAATVRNMFDFPKQFPGTTTVTLKENYRSLNPILETTNCLIAESEERYTKDLRSTRGDGQKPRLITCKDEDQQTEFVIDRVLTHYEQGVPLRKQAVLFRAGHLSAILELELTRRGIPFHKYGGLRFLEAAHVRDLLAFLRIVENPRDEMAWFRSLQLMDGIGPATARKVMDHIANNEFNLKSITEFTPPPSAKQAMGDFSTLICDLADSAENSPAEDVERIREFYDPYLEREYDNHQARSRDLESLAQIAAGYQSRQKFLSELQLDPPTSSSDLAGAPYRDDDWLVLSTIHSAKGCEWDTVYLIHAADGFLPSDMSCGSEEEIEEERRLTYVALTRARDFLYVSWPLRYYHKWYAVTDRHTYAQLCRFFTDEVCQTLEHVPLDQPTPADELSRAEPEQDVGEVIRKMWE